MCAQEKNSASTEARLSAVNDELRIALRDESHYKNCALDIFEKIKYIVSELQQDDKELQFKMGQLCEGAIGCKPLVYADERVQMALRTWYDDLFSSYLSAKYPTESIIVILTETEEVVFCASREGSFSLCVERYSKGYWEKYVVEELLPSAQLKDIEDDISKTKERIQGKYSKIDDSKYFSEYIDKSD